jgi:hypothetical protein
VTEEDFQEGQWYPLIRVGDDAVNDGAAIVDPENNPLLACMFGSNTALAQEIHRFRIKNPLLLILFRDRINKLYDSLGFDLPSYGDGSNSSEKLRSSNWNRILKQVGVRYFDGDGDTISLLFPSQDRASAALALALAGSFKRFDVVPADAPYTFQLSEKLG